MKALLLDEFRCPNRPSHVASRLAQCRGGCRVRSSTENLMLQPWEGEDGAKRKDRLEVKLQCLVCSGQVPLDEAQDAIYTDWQAAYHLYARTKCHRAKLATE